MKKEQCFPRVSQALLAIEYGKYKMFGSLITIFLDPRMKFDQRFDPNRRTVDFSNYSEGA